jgi:hypothetical protein
MATVCTSTPAPCSSRSLVVMARSTLVFMPPHRPLSVVTTIMPAAFTSLTFMKGCTYSGFAWLRCAAMLRILSL